MNADRGIHAKLKERLDKGEDLPQYIKDHPIYYAGPAKTPSGMACGSMGPTTAGRMDPYVDLFQSHGGSMIMLAKGNRSQQVTDACKKHVHGVQSQYFSGKNIAERHSRYCGIVYFFHSNISSHQPRLLSIIPYQLFFCTKRIEERIVVVSGLKDYFWLKT